MQLTTDIYYHIYNFLDIKTLLELSDDIYFAKIFQSITKSLHNTLKKLLDNKNNSSSIEIDARVILMQEAVASQSLRAKRLMRTALAVKSLRNNDSKIIIAKLNEENEYIINNLFKIFNKDLVFLFIDEYHFKYWEKHMLYELIYRQLYYPQIVSDNISQNADVRKYYLGNKDKHIKFMIFNDYEYTIERSYTLYEELNNPIENKQKLFADALSKGYLRLCIDLIEKEQYVEKIAKPVEENILLYEYLVKKKLIKLDLRHMIPIAIKNHHNYFLEKHIDFGNYQNIMINASEYFIEAINSNNIYVAEKILSTYFNPFNNFGSVVKAIATKKTKIVSLILKNQYLKTCDIDLIFINSLLYTNYSLMTRILRDTRISRSCFDIKLFRRIIDAEITNTINIYGVVYRLTVKEKRKNIKDNTKTIKLLLSNISLFDSSLKQNPEIKIDELVKAAHNKIRVNNKRQ